MPNQTVQQIIFDKNFITEGKVALNNGGYVFNYHFLILRDELSAANGYDVVVPGDNPDDLSTQNIEYATFSQLTDSQKLLFNYAFHGSSQFPLVNPHFRVRVLSESSGHDVA